MPKGVKGSPRKGGARVLVLPFALAGLGLAGLLYGLRVGRVGSVDEDAYISLRYARNLIEGHGLVFNPGGERVEGITNLLWTLSVALVSWVSGVGLPRVALLLGVFCGALTLLAVYLWCLRIMVACGFGVAGAAIAALPAPLFLVFVPGLTFYSASGLETPLFALLMVCGLYVASVGVVEDGASYLSLTLGGLALGAATITRPEGALALAAGSFAVFVCLWSRHGLFSRGLWRGTLIFSGSGAAIVLGTTLWRMAYYGSPLPNTAYAKSGALEVAFQWGVPYLLEAAQSTGFLAGWALLLAVSVLDGRFFRLALGALALTPVWAAYVVYVGGDYMPSYRLVTPLLPVIFAAVFATPAPILAALKRRWSAGGMRSAALAYPLALLPLAALGAFVLAQAPSALQQEREHKADNTRWTEYRRAAANWFDENDPNAVVAANAVGAFGYYSDEVVIVDMLGLNNAHIARHGTENPNEPPGHQVGDGEYVLSREPDYIIPFGMKSFYRIGSTRPYFIGDRQLARSEELQREYEPVEVSLETGSGQRGTLSMFKREDGA